MSRSFPQHLIKISANPEQDWQWNYEAEVEAFQLYPNLKSSNFHEIDANHLVFNITNYLESHLIKLIKSTPQIFEHQGHEFDQANATIESILTLCQDFKWLKTVYDHLKNQARLGDLKQASVEQLRDQRKSISYLKAATKKQDLVIAPAIIDSQDLTFQEGVLYIAIADPAPLLQAPINKETLILELGSTISHFREATSLPIIGDLQHFDRNLAELTGRLYNTNPQTQQQNAVNFMQANLGANAILNQTVGCIPAAMRQSLADESKYGPTILQSLPKDAGPKAISNQQVQQFYFTSLVQAIPLDSLLALVFLGFTLLDLNFKIKLLRKHIRRLSGFEVIIIVRTYNHPATKSNVGNRTGGTIHFPTIAAAVYVQQKEHLQPLRAVYGIGLKNGKGKAEQVRIHFLDPKQVFAVQVAINFIMHHNKLFDPKFFKLNGFQIDNVHFSAFPVLEDVLALSPSTIDWMRDNTLAAVFAAPQFAVDGATGKGTGEIVSNFFTLIFAYTSDHTPDVSHPLDEVLRTLSPPEMPQPKYKIVDASLLNQPVAFRPRALQRKQADHSGSTASVFKQSDAVAALASYTEAAPDLPVLNAAPVAQAIVANPTWFVNQFARQRAALHAAVHDPTGDEKQQDEEDEDMDEEVDENPILTQSPLATGSQGLTPTQTTHSASSPTVPKPNLQSTYQTRGNKFKGFVDMDVQQDSRKRTSEQAPSSSTDPPDIPLPIDEDGI